MTILSKHGPQEVVYVLNVSYEGLYAKLREVLSPEDLKLFAVPGRRSTEHYWFTEGDVAFKSFSRATQEEQNEAAIQLEVKKAAILPQLLASPELSKYAEQLFRIPSEGELLIVEDDARKPFITLVQWGCRLARGDKEVNPLEKIINWPRPDHDNATLELVYTDGEHIIKTPFTVRYKARHAFFTSNTQGEIALGRVKHGEQIAVWQGHTESGQDVQSLEVIPGQDRYLLTFTCYHSFAIYVTDQNGQPLPDIGITLSYAGDMHSHLTNTEGAIFVTDLALQKGYEHLSLTETGQPNTTCQFDINRQVNELYYQLQRTPYCHPIIKVLDKTDGLPVENYPLILEHGDQTSTRSSGKEGALVLEAMPADAELTITDGLNKYNNTHYTLAQGEHTLVFHVKRPQPEAITVRLVNRKDEPFPDVPISLSMAGQTYHTTTDNQGVSQVKGGIPEGEKYFLAEFALTNERGQKKDYSRRVKFVPDQMDYTIKIKPFNWRWLLLLLLLLPLLLLIEFDKDIQVKTYNANTQKVMSGVETHLSYIRYALYQNGQFFTADTIALQEVTDTSGLATFKGLNYTLYSWVFHNLHRANVWIQSACYATEESHPLFHWVASPVELALTDQPITLDFLVIDADDGQPLPDALVQIRTGQGGVDSLTTDVAGRAIFSKLPKCGQLTWVSGYLEGYYPDTLHNLKVADINGNNISARTLRLRPIKKKITFFVTDCRNGEPLPGAKATITIEDPNGNKKQNHRTNINGVGKGEYDDLHITQKLRIEVEKSHYKPGIWDAGLTVGEFVALPDSLRTICLEPLPNTLDFQNIDSLTQRPLSGVTNQVTITGPDGTRTETATSNRNGIFSVPNLKVGEKVSVVATLAPHYYPNRHTILARNVQALLDGNTRERMIPLTPVAPPCNTSGSADSGSNYHLAEYNMGQSYGRFMFKYYTDSDPDDINVYCAKKEDISSANKILGPVSSTSHTYIWLNLSCDIITVEVIGDTNWEYTVHCPE